MVVELVQTVNVPFDDSGSTSFPMRSGATLLISQDAVDGDTRPEPRIRFVISKLHDAEREERIRTYYIASGLADRSDDARFQINFGLLHAGA